MRDEAETLSPRVTMADQIMGGVVEMVMGGDDDESDGDGKEGRTEVCPSVPEMGIVPRLVARQVTVPWLAEAAIIVPLGGLVLGAGGTKHWEASKLGFLGMQIALVLFSFIVPCHRRTIAPGGMLEQLGVGKRLSPRRTARRSCCSRTSCAYPWVSSSLSVWS